MTHYKALLFDLDGVIVETAHFHYEAWRRLANEKLGFDISHEFNETLKGVSRPDSLDLILKQGNKTLDQATKLEYATLKNDWYLELASQMTAAEILPGITDFFRQIKATDLKIGLGSVSKNAKMILEAVGMLQDFDAIIDGTCISKGKPDPEVFLKGAAAFGLSPSECIVFEDAVAGIEAGKRAGMKVVGIGQPEVLTQADVVFKDLTGVKLADLLKSLSTIDK
jgi:beta-phosphoglucomutase